MLNGGAVVGIGAVGGCCGGFVGLDGGGTGSSVGKGVIGAGDVGSGGRVTPNVGANVLFVPKAISCADTIAMETEPISRIESFIFDRLLYCYC